MRFILNVLLAVILVLVAGPAVAEAGNDSRVDSRGSEYKRTDQEITNFIYDATIPWPFRKHIMDSDGDGIADNMDKCPNSPKGFKVDAYGCTKMETEFLDKGVFRTSGIHFETAKWTIKPESYKILDAVAATLAQWPDVRVEIAGHADVVGSDADNQKLSERRAQAVLEYLATKHPEIKPKRFTAAGYGETKPIATRDTREGRTQNRRVEFTILNREVLRKESPEKS